MSFTDFIGDHTFLVGAFLIGAFVIWKFILQPIMNEGEPIKPTEDQVKTFGEKMQENLNTETDL